MGGGGELLGMRLAACALGMALAAATGCATRKPVLYPNDHMADVGTEVSQQDVDDCIAMAESADLQDSRAAETAKSTGIGAAIGAGVGAAIGAVTGAPGTGAAMGAAGGGAGGFLSGLFRSSDPDPVFKRYVEACLRERGYEPVGWK